MKLAAPITIFILLVAAGAQAFVVAKTSLTRRLAPDLIKERRGCIQMKNSDNTSNETTEKIQRRTWNPLRLAVLKVRHYA
jgi:hypothetical protein